MAKLLQESKSIIRPVFKAGNVIERNGQTTDAPGGFKRVDSHVMAINSPPCFFGLAAWFELSEFMHLRIDTRRPTALFSPSNTTAVSLS